MAVTAQGPAQAAAIADPLLSPAVEQSQDLADLQRPQVPSLFDAPHLGYEGSTLKDYEPMLQQMFGGSLGHLPERTMWMTPVSNEELYSGKHYDPEKGEWISMIRDPEAVERLVDQHVAHLAGIDTMTADEIINAAVVKRLITAEQAAQLQTLAAADRNNQLNILRAQLKLDYMAEVGRQPDAHHILRRIAYEYQVQRPHDVVTQLDTVLQPLLDKKARGDAISPEEVNTAMQGLRAILATRTREEMDLIRRDFARQHMSDTNPQHMLTLEVAVQRAIDPALHSFAYEEAQLLTQGFSAEEWARVIHNHLRYYTGAEDTQQVQNLIHDMTEAQFQQIEEYGAQHIFPQMPNTSLLEDGSHLLLHPLLMHDSFRQWIEEDSRLIDFPVVTAAAGGAVWKFGRAGTAWLSTQLPMLGETGAAATATGVRAGTSVAAVDSARTWGDSVAEGLDDGARWYAGGVTDTREDFDWNFAQPKDPIYLVNPTVPLEDQRATQLSQRGSGQTHAQTFLASIESTGTPEERGARLLQYVQSLTPSQLEVLERELENKHGTTAAQILLQLQEATSTQKLTTDDAAALMLLISGIPANNLTVLKSAIDNGNATDFQQILFNYLDRGHSLAEMQSAYALQCNDGSSVDFQQVYQTLLSSDLTTDYLNHLEQAIREQAPDTTDIGVTLALYGALRRVDEERAVALAQINEKLLALQTDPTFEQKNAAIAEVAANHPGIGAAELEALFNRLFGAVPSAETETAPTDDAAAVPGTDDTSSTSAGASDQASQYTVVPSTSLSSYKPNFGGSYQPSYGVRGVPALRRMSDATETIAA